MEETVDVETKVILKLSLRRLCFSGAFSDGTRALCYRLEILQKAILRPASFNWDPGAYQSLQNEPDTLHCGVLVKMCLSFLAVLWIDLWSEVCVISVTKQVEALALQDLLDMCWNYAFIFCSGKSLDMRKCLVKKSDGHFMVNPLENPFLKSLYFCRG